MFMSWLFNLEKGKHEHELAAFKDVTVWQVSAAGHALLACCIKFGCLIASLCIVLALEVMPWMA